jgi:hypothetical protein
MACKSEPRLLWSCIKIRIIVINPYTLYSSFSHRRADENANVILIPPKTDHFTAKYGFDSQHPNKSSHGGGFGSFHSRALSKQTGTKGSPPPWTWESISLLSHVSANNKRSTFTPKESFKNLNTFLCIRIIYLKKKNFLAVLRIEPRASHMLGNQSTTRAMPTVLFVF